MLDADSENVNVLDRGIDQVAHLAFDAELSAGDRIGDFEILSEIGRGGMGIVYAARDTKLGRIAALKLLPDSRHRESDSLIAEAQAASALDHPNVATIYQVGETEDGRRFIAMARYEGETLRDRIRRGPIESREAFRIAREIASGLAAAHTVGLVHRDVKPENIFITQQGVAKLLDFGIAKLGDAVSQHSTRGTVLYMSPEQVRQQFAGPASDVWSLAVVLFEMLTGRAPFNGATGDEITSQIAASVPVTLPAPLRKLPSSAVDVLVKGLEKDSTRRYRNATEFHSALDRASRLWSRPRQIRAIAAGLVLVIAGGWLAVHKLAPDDRAQKPLSLAVLPVVGDSSDHESLSLASALGDEIAARVVGLRRMRLVRTTEVGTSNAPGLHLLRLTVEHGGPVPVISLSLDDARSGQSLWTARRSLDHQELRGISRDLVIGTLTAIGRPPSDRERAAIGESFPSKPEAYEEYLKGNRFLAIRTPASVESAVVSFRRATSHDSLFAAAYARQAYAYTVLVDWGWKPGRLFPGDPLTAGLALADRATELDSTSADAWLARAYILVQRNPAKFAGAIEAFQHAITLDPYNAEAFHQYGQSLMALGRYTEALAAYRRVLDLEPDRAMTLVPMAAITKRLGRKLEALAYLDSAIAAYPRVAYARATRSLLRAQLGDIRGARNDADAAVAIPSGYRVPQLAALARAAWLDGDSATAIKAVTEAEHAIDLAAVSPTDGFWIAVAEVTLGRIDRARDYVRRTRPRGAVEWFMMQADELAEFRKDPEIAAIVAEADPRK